MKPLHVQLREMREAAGLQQKQVSDRIGESQSSVSRFESGEREPMFVVIDAWSAACGFRFVPMFVAADAPDDPPSPADYVFLDGWRALSPERRALVGALIAELRGAS